MDREKTERNRELTIRALNGETTTALQEEYGMRNSTICHIITRELKKHDPKCTGLRYARRYKERFYALLL